MKMRYRKPSLKTALGVTKAKRRINKASGKNHVTKIINAPKNAKTRTKRKVGYYSTPLKVFRLISRLLK